MTHAACMDNTYHQLHRCTQTRLPSSFSHLKPKHTNWNITNARTHTSPHLYANSASEHEQATESLGKKQGRLPLSLLLHPSSFSSEHFSRHLSSYSWPPHSFVLALVHTHAQTHIRHTHIPVPQPLYYPSPSTTSPPLSPPSRVSAACRSCCYGDRSYLHSVPLASPAPGARRQRERERIRRCRRVRLESELEDTRVRQKEIKRRKKKNKNTKGEKQRTCTKNGFCSQSITQSHYFYGLLMASYLLTHSLICWLKMNADWKRVDWARLPRAKMKVDLICSWTLLKSTGLGKYKRIQQCLFSCVFVVARTVVFISTSPFLPLKWKTVRKSCPHCILSQ